MNLVAPPCNADFTVLLNEVLSALVKRFLLFCCHWGQGLDPLDIVPQF